MIDFSNYRKKAADLELILSKNDLSSNPLDLCADWLKEVQKRELVDGNAMTLSSVSSDGIVSSRVVLLKYLDPKGFIFFSNYQSRKAKDIASHPQVALNFYWPTLNRQLSVLGLAEKIERSESERYFRTRPRLNQLQTLASMQDEVIQSLEQVLDKAKQLDQKYAHQDIPLPSYWGGYLVRPYQIEFWQGGDGRLHTRYNYKLVNGCWEISQLSP